MVVTQCAVGLLQLIATERGPVGGLHHQRVALQVVVARKQGLAVSIKVGIEEAVGIGILCLANLKRASVIQVAA